MSLPAWAAWIEIRSSCVSFSIDVLSLPAWAAWIEMIMFVQPRAKSACRCPHGQRGLKSRIKSFSTTSFNVAARMGSVD